MSAGADYYRMLGVPREAPDREIKRAYYELARKLHPDKAASPEEAAKNASELAAISQAYNTLKDPKKREEYDAQLKGKPAGPAGPAPARPPVAAPAPSAGSAAAVAPGGMPPTAKPGAGAPPVAASGPAAPPAAAAAGAPRVSASDQLAMKRSLAQKAFVKGMQHFKRAEYKQAVEFFEAAVNNDPESEAQYHAKLAHSLIRSKGSFTRAVTHAQRACEMDTYSLDFKFLLAEVHETAGSNTKAKEIYEDILKWDPTNTNAAQRLKLIRGITGADKPSTLAKLLPSIFGKKD